MDLTNMFMTYEFLSLFKFLQIMSREHEDEHTDVASHICPGLSLSVAKQPIQPPYFLNSDALNYAMLDHLTHFTSTVRECTVHTYNHTSLFNLFFSLESLKRCSSWI